MSKPNGIIFSYDDKGFPAMRTTSASRAEDAIWDAVATAISEGWSVKEFRDEAASAWQHELKEEMKAADKAFSS